MKMTRRMRLLILTLLLTCLLIFSLSSRRARHSPLAAQNQSDFDPSKPADSTTDFTQTFPSSPSAAGEVPQAKLPYSERRHLRNSEINPELGVTPEQLAELNANKQIRFKSVSLPSRRLIHHPILGDVVEIKYKNGQTFFEPNDEVFASN